MSKLRDLDSLRRRDYLASPKTAMDDLSAYGRRFLEDEDCCEAFHFFERAGDTEGLAECKRLAIEVADHELLWQLAHSRHVQVSDEDWRACSDQAIRMEKFSVAAYILQRLGDTAARDRLPGAPARSGDQTE